jgi:hypothetical protein
MAGYLFILWRSSTLRRCRCYGKFVFLKVDMTVAVRRCSCRICPLSFQPGPTNKHMSRDTKQKQDALESSTSYSEQARRKGRCRLQEGDGSCILGAMTTTAEQPQPQLVRSNGDRSSFRFPAKRNSLTQRFNPNILTTCNIHHV